jgi:uncharacterized protein (TIGR02271 family)
MSSEPHSMKEETNQQLLNSKENSTFVLPVIEETVNVEKKIIETGKVKVSKIVNVETETVNLLKTEEEVNIERIAINQFVQTPPQPLRYEGDTIIIPVLQEVMVTEKRYLLVEEVRITKRKIESVEQQEIVLRKEEIQVQHSENNLSADNK